MSQTAPKPMHPASRCQQGAIWHTLQKGNKGKHARPMLAKQMWGYAQNSHPVMKVIADAPPNF
jgi:hypothetical protein